MPGMNESKEVVYMARLEAAAFSPDADHDDEVNIFEYLAYLMLKVRQNRFQIEDADAKILALELEVQALKFAMGNVMDHGTLFMKFTISSVPGTDKLFAVDSGVVALQFTISADEQKTTTVPLTLTPSGTDIQES